MEIRSVSGSDPSISPVSPKDKPATREEKEWIFQNMDRLIDKLDRLSRTTHWHPRFDKRLKEFHQRIQEMKQNKNLTLDELLKTSSDLMAFARKVQPHPVPRLAQAIENAKQYIETPTSQINYDKLDEEMQVILEEVGRLVPTKPTKDLPPPFEMKRKR